MLVIVDLPVQYTLDLAVDRIPLPVNALGVDLEQNGHGVAGAGCDLCRVCPTVEPGGHRRMTQVVGTQRERRGCLLRRETDSACLMPDPVVDGGRHTTAALDAPEQPAIRSQAG